MNPYAVSDSIAPHSPAVRPALLASSPRKRASSARARARPAAALPPEQLAALAQALLPARRLRGLDASLAIGRAIVEHLYDGDPSAWRLRSPKVLSLRRLAATALLPTTPAALCRALMVHEVWSRAAAGQPWSQLSASHYRAVSGLDATLQARLLEDAWRRGLPADELRRLADARRRRRAPKGGRLSEHPIARLIERLEREVAAGDAAALDASTDLERSRAEAWAVRSETVAWRCLELARRLRHC